MYDFFGHPIWNFLSSIAALITLFILMKTPLSKYFEAIASWLIAVLAFCSFIVGNIVGQTGLSHVLENLSSRQLDIVTAILIFAFTILSFVIANSIKKLMLQYRSKPDHSSED
ncbi:hypothetical protein GX553_04055 [Candidatus Peribacteria bacterium]|nr:hypothetical protein [Candidatus Peribacteria bacterium]